MKFAIIDIETTGGSAEWHRITEIAIFIHYNNTVVDQFQTLINPERPIPPSITSLTGISNELVADAPIFQEVANKIYTLISDCIFVAHNVNFDYSFVKKEFERIGINFSSKRLCTVRLSRKLLPGLKSYSLGRLCAQIGIFINDRHRAGGDAEATSKLFKILAEKENFKTTISFFLKTTSKEFSLPPHISKELFDSLPDATGVYIFHDEKGKIIYVGKAQKIKTRVYEHFSSNTHTKTKTLFHNSIHKVTYQETGSEFIALLLENELIKKHYPKYNKANKKFDLNTGIYQYEDQNGYLRLSIAKSGKNDSPMLTFPSESEAISFVLQKIKEYNLCMKLTGILSSKSMCPSENSDTQICHEVCHTSVSSSFYNERFVNAFNASASKKTFIVKCNGRHNLESGFAIIENGRFLGFGFLDDQPKNYDINELKKRITRCYDTRDSQAIIEKYTKTSEVEVIYL